jgi:hypothetical protein
MILTGRPIAVRNCKRVDEMRADEVKSEWIKNAPVASHNSRLTFQLQVDQSQFVQIP